MSHILHRITAQTRDIGFPVRRLLPSAKARMVGPFVFFDHMGPALFVRATREGDVRAHPHIGLATVTYLLSGAMMHRDSLGFEQRITPGAINLMVAGRGIVHSERIPEDIRDNGEAVHGLQMWIALPVKDEACAPAFTHYPDTVIPAVSQEGVTAHVLMGSAFGQVSPVTTFTQTMYVYATMDAGAQMTVPQDYAQRALYVVSGSVMVGTEPVAQGELVVLGEGHAVQVTASEDACVMMLGGEPLDGDRFLWWNFVASDKQLIEAAKIAWENDDRTVFPAVGGETERIPLPVK